jgi:hypothetical protein
MPKLILLNKTYTNITTHAGMHDSNRCRHCPHIKYHRCRCCLHYSWTVSPYQGATPMKVQRTEHGGGVARYSQSFRGSKPRVDIVGIKSLRRYKTDTVSSQSHFGVDLKLNGKMISSEIRIQQGIFPIFHGLLF